MEKTPKSYYEKLVREDIIALALPMLKVGAFTVREVDGRLVARTAIPPESPWHHVVELKSANCYQWRSVMFDLLGGRYVPSGCQNCYKVVVRPKTLRQLFDLLRLQQALRLPSKCGIEVREYVHALYGGYFYNEGLNEGLDCYRTVRHMVTEWNGLGEDVSVILKRGCTEMEHKCGPSDKWQITEGQLESEALFNRWVTRDSDSHRQTEPILTHVHRKWVEFAFANGDPTYAEFTDGKPLFPPSVTYHDFSRYLWVPSQEASPDELIKEEMK